MAILDTLKAVRILRDTGIDEPAAEATVEVIRDATAELVTKDHLRAEFDVREARMDARFDQLRAEIYQSQNRMLLAIMSLNIATAAVALAIARLT